MATDIDDLAEQVANLSEEELAEFRQWFAEYDAELWDRQFERDVEAGNLDDAAEKALKDHEEGRTRRL